MRSSPRKRQSDRDMFRQTGKVTDRERQRQRQMKRPTQTETQQREILTSTKWNRNMVASWYIPEPETCYCPKESLKELHRLNESGSQACYSLLNKTHNCLIIPAPYSERRLQSRRTVYIKNPTNAREYPNKMSSCWKLPNISTYQAVFPAYATWLASLPTLS